jgi:hypothetical protein
MALYCHRRGLTINYDKSYVMEFSSDPYIEGQQVTFAGPTAQIGQLAINKTDSFKYLAYRSTETSLQRILRIWLVRKPGKHNTQLKEQACAPTDCPLPPDS